jgi:hypothetical protein
MFHRERVTFLADPSIPVPVGEDVDTSVKILGIFQRWDLVCVWASEKCFYRGRRRKKRENMRQKWWPVGHGKAEVFVVWFILCCCWPDPCDTTYLRLLTCCISPAMAAELYTHRQTTHTHTQEAAAAQKPSS